MILSEFSVKRPVTTIMLILSILVLGGITLWQLKVELMPKLTFPNLAVVCEYTGVAPQEIEKSLTKPIENVVRTVPDIKRVKSTSVEGAAIINAEFNWGVDMDEASNQVRDRLGQVKDYLPKDAKEPVVYKIDMSAMPVAFMALRGEMPRDRLKKYIDDIIQPQIERLNGVASVLTLGGQDREIQVNVDRNRLAGYGLSLSQIYARIQMENLNVSAGNVTDAAQTNFLVRGLGEFKKPEELNGLVVGMKNSQPVYLRDVAAIIDGFADDTGYSRVNQISSISLIVQKETDANTVEVCRLIKKLLPKLRSEMPAGMQFDFVVDFSDMIQTSVNSLEQSAIEGAVLAAVIIFIFLGQIPPTLIICLSIPVSLLIAFIAMFFGGSTINMMSLGGLVVALGRLVDDSVVVMENIFRRRQLGQPAKQAAIDGSSEVGIAVISSTLVTVIVFLPIFFAHGVVVQLFKDFAGTIFFAMMGSLLVAFTIVPMLASKLFRREIQPEARIAKISFYQHLREFYSRTLTSALKHKARVIVGAVTLLVITGVMIAKIGKDFVPHMVSGMYQIIIKQPKGSDVESTDNLARRVEKSIFDNVPDIDIMNSIAGTSRMSARHAALSGSIQGPNTCEMFVNLKKGKYRVTTEKQFYDIIDGIARENKGADISLQAAGSQLTGTGRPIEIKIFGADLDRLKRIGDDLSAALKTVPGLKSVSSSMEQGLPEFSLEYNREKIARYGLSVAQLNHEISLAVDGEVASIYREAGEEIDIRVRLKKEFRKNFSDILDLPVSSPMGFTFPLKDVVRVKYAEGPAQIDRENAKRIVTVSADVSGRSLSAAVRDVIEKLRQMSLPVGYFYEFGGQESDRQESFKILGLALLASILLIYMILASLYESLIHPFTILLSVPFAFTGAIGALFLTGTSLGVTALIGMIMLVGIVATNAIVLIDFIIKRRATEPDCRKAIVEAASIRLRPILITAIATLFALLPVGLGNQEGMELQAPLGIAVVGGLFSSTLLTLYIIPVIFEIFDSLSRKLKKP